MREHLIVPSIGSRDVAWAEWPYIRRLEHFLKLLDVVNDAFNVHGSQSSTTNCDGSNGVGVGTRIGIRL
jgi:hypothetical protein